jgi:NTP pyrophosphatase (non-canonical NTP hydrolase)
MTTEETILQFCESQWGHKPFAAVALKLAEESGEIAGACVKIPECRATLADLDKELGDALIVLSQLAAKRGTTLEALRALRFDQIQERARPRICAENHRPD